MDELNNTLQLPSEEIGGTVNDSGMNHSSFGSGFDGEHPFPSYEELRNAGFSDDLAHNIAESESHSYTDRELFHVIYESENPVDAYNEMMAAKAQNAIDKADALMKGIENNGMLECSSEVLNKDEASHYNEPASIKTLDNEQELGSCDCRSECTFNTGKAWMSSDYGYSN